MAIKKTALYSSLWASCDELRGGMDASQYKDYVLTLLFMKYVSDKYAGNPNGTIVVPENGSFQDMVALKNDKEIGDKINKIIGRLAEENDLKGVIDVADFNDEDKLGKDQEMVDRLSNLVGIFQGLNLSANRAEGDDLLGDAYEYLMRHFATESGKSKGQFYTPAEVSRILAQVVGITSETRQDQTVYDPTCGSGSLLLKVADEAPRGLSIFGQENDNATAALARMNMILHDHPTAEIWKDNTLSSPHWKSPDGRLKTFDFAVANPPFSYKSWSNGVNLSHDEFGRFEYGVPPDKNGDYAFLLHILKSLKSTGKGAVILPHGVLFRGNAEARIRQAILRQGYLKGIIGLPANLFYGTGIPACILVIDKAGAAQRRSLFMIDASRGFMKDGNKNRLRSQDIHKIVDVFNQQLEIPGYSRLVALDEIAGNDYNLNIPRYIDGSEPEDLHDLDAHLNGGIPQADLDNLQNYWTVFPNLRRSLFTPGARPGYWDSLVEASQVKATILNHPEFQTFTQTSLALFEGWCQAHRDSLSNIQVGDHPKTLVGTLSENLLERYASAVLLDKYDIYQLLMDYWSETMQDDVYLISQDGWAAGKVLREIVARPGEKTKETPDLVLGKKKYKSDLIPSALIIARYLPTEQAQIDQLQLALDSQSQDLESLLEEHGGDEGLLEEARVDEKITLAGVTARLKLLKGQPGDERALLEQCHELFERESAAKKALKAAQVSLDEAVFSRYSKLTEDDVRQLVVEDKWLATLRAGVRAEVERVTQRLATRVKTLEERYAEPLPKLAAEVEKLTARVEGHLARVLGFGQGRRLVQSELGSLPEDWRCSRVEQCADVASGTTPSRAKQERYFHNGEHDWVKTLDLTNSEIEIVQEQITCYALKETSLRLFPAGTVLVAMYGGFNQIGRTGLLKRPAAVNQAISAIIPSGLVVPRFLLEQLNYRVEHWRTIASSSRKDPNITGQDVRTFKLPLPPLPEQKAIAEVLSDMDAEITALEARLAKLRDIKQGMMQELLTGRTRLV